MKWVESSTSKTIKSLGREEEFDFMLPIVLMVSGKWEPQPILLRTAALFVTRNLNVFGTFPFGTASTVFSLTLCFYFIVSLNCSIGCTSFSLYCNLSKHEMFGVQLH